MIELLKKCQCLLIRTHSNLFHFSGYDNADAAILIFPDKKYYLTDARYTEEAAELLQGFEIVDIRRNMADTIQKIITDNSAKTIGIENDLPMNFYRLITGRIAAEFIDISDDIQKMRAIKTPEQIALIKKAQEITDKTFSDILPKIKECMTERQLCMALENTLLENGADGIAFKSIVAFGKNSARPHALVGDKRLENGSVIKLDFGARYKGWCADMTRTIFFGMPTAQQKEIYNAVLEAQQAALDNLYTGISCKAAYALANDCFVARGLDKYFLHSLGHGLGTDVHEIPSLSPRSEEFLQENMVVSIEPGLYIPHQFGVRIEDIVFFKKSSIENLTKSQKAMIIL